MPPFAASFVAVPALPETLMFAVPAEILPAVRFVRFAPLMAGSEAIVVALPTLVTLPVRLALVVTVAALPVMLPVSVPVRPPLKVCAPVHVLTLPRLSASV